MKIETNEGRKIMRRDIEILRVITIILVFGFYGFGFWKDGIILKKYFCFGFVVGCVFVVFVQFIWKLFSQWKNRYKKVK